jgi:hypothetical protein
MQGVEHKMMEKSHFEQTLQLVDVLVSFAPTSSPG